MFVHGDGAVLPGHVRSVAAAASGKLVWGEGEQTDFYDRPDQVGFALDAVDDHFQETL